MASRSLRPPTEDSAVWYVLRQHWTGHTCCVCCEAEGNRNWVKVRGPHTLTIVKLPLYNDEAFLFEWPYDPERFKNGQVPFVICDACYDLRKMEALL